MRSTSFGYDTGAWVAPATPPSWLTAVRGARVRLRPGQALPLGVLVAAAVAGVVVVGYGAARLDAPWSVLAGLAGLGGMVLALRGLPLAGGVALLVAVACWGFVARDLVPGSFGDIGGVAGLLAGNLAFAVPMVAGFCGGVWADGRRTAVAAVREGLRGQRWFGVNIGEPEPQLPGLEEIPSATFFALPSGRCAHLVAAGRQVALVATTVWPRGGYGVDAGRIVRNDRPFAPGTEEVDGVADDLRAWSQRLDPAGAVCRAFLVVHPASGRLSDAVRLSVTPIEGVEVVAAERFVEAAGGFLAAGANTISVEVMEALADLYAGDQAEPAGPVPR